MKNKLRIILESVIVGVLVFVLTVTNIFSSLDYIARDAMYQRARGIDSDIKIIGIDEKTLEELGPIQTWSRSYYAQLLDKLNEDEESKPLLVGFDIIFAGEAGEDDAVFARSAEDSGNVVVVSHLMYGKRAEKNAKGLWAYPVTNMEVPYPLLAKATKYGYSNVAQDDDGIVRKVVPSEEYNGETQYMFAKVMYDRYCELTDTQPRDIPLDKFGRSNINYSGVSGDYEFISMIDVLKGEIDPRTFSDSIILVGAYAPGMQDDFTVPLGRGQEMYGVEIHANILQAYMQGRFSVNGNPYILGLITAVIAMLLHFLFRKLKVWQSVIVLLASIGIYVAVCVALNNNGHSFNLIYFPLITVLSFGYALAINYVEEQAKRKKVLNAFRKYVAPQIVEEIAKKGDFNIKLGGENRDIAVLFVDIRGFTTMSEALEPEQVVSILNEYLALTTASIFNNSGTLDKFVGDATMAVFNSPFDLPDYEYKAVCAAMDIVAGGEAIEEKFMKEYGRSVGFGVGVNVGPAVVGNVGCDFRMDFTAIGDTVNTAARLEANAKKGQVLISDVLYERLKDRIEVKDVGEIPLKGKSKGVFVYEVTKVLGREEKSE